MQMVHDESEVLADRIGIPLAVWEAMFGRWWVTNDAEPWHDFDGDPSGGSGFPPTPWHVRGHVPQLMLRVFEHGVFIGRPEGIVRDRPGEARTVEYQPAHQEYVAAHELEAKAPEIVKWMLVTRRRQFRWCADCWEHTAPELMAGAVCFDCTGGEPLPIR